MPEPIIKVKDMSIIYHRGHENEFRASDNVNMEIYPDEYIIFFGPSGCGKSTLLYSILGILPPTDGKVLVKGEDIYGYNAEQMVRFQTKIIGIMYQAFYLIPSLSIVDNVALPQIFEGVPPAQRRIRALELLKRFGIDRQADKLPEALSGGQIQRVSVARSLVNDPEIILADEPVGNLDSISADQVMNTLDEINQKDKKTIILVTHDAKYLPYAHRVIYMKDGKVVRVVPNPEKKQIAKVDRQKTLVTEFEQLAKIHPYLTPPELKVKSIINYLTQDLTFEQLDRLEKTTRLMLEGKINREKFYEIVEENYKTGGVGLGPARAKVMAERIERILKQAEDVRRYRRRQDQGMFYSKEDDLIKKLLKHVSDEYGKLVAPWQKRIIKEAIRSRISGLIKKEEFIKKIGDPQTDGGAGLSKKDTEFVTRYLEKLLFQGLEIEGANH